MIVVLYKSWLTELMKISNDVKSENALWKLNNAYYIVMYIMYNCVMPDDLEIVRTIKNKSVCAKQTQNSYLTG